MLVGHHVSASSKKSAAIRQDIDLILPLFPFTMYLTIKFAYQICRTMLELFYYLIRGGIYVCCFYWICAASRGRRNGVLCKIRFWRCKIRHSTDGSTTTLNGRVCRKRLYQQSLGSIWPVISSKSGRARRIMLLGSWQATEHTSGSARRSTISRISPWQNSLERLEKALFGM